MQADPSAPAKSPIGPPVVFIAAIIMQVLWLPYLAIMIFFGALGFGYYSPADKLFFLLAAAYLPAFPLAAIIGARVRRRQEPMAATVIVLSPILLLMPTFVFMVINISSGLLGGGAGP